ncbi:D123-domain-containing protein [Jimgerdemannia flammicorona]|uniref:D123-domain-containing protein n=2 Tax=Jimgerdemannia flammicorona TaxID=994334 RepID=A0A433QKE9_9FUNG|nr:D123-domain-containing protein [Jimgerdemannia flammicorona]
MTLLTSSERVYGDLEAILEEQPEGTSTLFDCYIVLRQWEHIPIEYEFRCFVNDGRINAISQYDCLVYFESLPPLKPRLQSAIVAYHATTIQPLLISSGFASANRYVVDFAFIEGDLARPTVIELNPFFNADGCLFNFSKDKAVLEQGPIEFRVNEGLVGAGVKLGLMMQWREMLDRV